MKFAANHICKSCLMCDYLKDVKLHKKHNCYHDKNKLHRCERCRMPFWDYQAVTQHKKNHLSSGVRYDPQNFIMKTSIADIYEKLRAYTFSTEELKIYGFPIESNVERGKVVYYHYGKSSLSLDDVNSECDRCKKKYTIMENSKNSNESECVFHIKKASKSANNSLVHSCCGKSSLSSGCQRNNYHVLRGSLPTTGFVKTNRRSDTSNRYSIYALDCEMCYTMRGLKISRVTIVDINGSLIYDTLVLPDEKIIDYNTEFSGLTADMFKDVKVKLENVQEYLLNLFTVETILVGHGLDSDLAALHFIHPLIVDTSVIFSDKKLRDKYVKQRLTDAAKAMLNKEIQKDTQGHDSAEDARTCMELMIWRIEADSSL